MVEPPQRTPAVLQMLMNLDIFRHISTVQRVCKNSFKSIDPPELELPLSEFMCVHS